jgi:hypothetical protein
MRFTLPSPVITLLTRPSPLWCGAGVMLRCAVVMWASHDSPASQRPPSSGLGGSQSSRCSKRHTRCSAVPQLLQVYLDCAGMVQGDVCITGPVYPYISGTDGRRQRCWSVFNNCAIWGDIRIISFVPLPAISKISCLS